MIKKKWGVSEPTHILKLECARNYVFVGLAINNV